MGNESIAIIGAGNLGLSIGKGILDKKVCGANQVWLTKRQITGIKSLEKQGFHVVSDNKAAVKACSVLIICVQPKQLEGLINEIKSDLRSDHVLVSTLTGVSTEQIAEMLPLTLPVVRAMPNTSIAIGESMTCLSMNEENDAVRHKVNDLFEAVGKTLWIEERLMQASTVLGASGIAFFMRYLRAATQGGVQMGFHSEDAQLIAMQTAKGAASLVLELGTHPEVEIDKVTTPMGCTIEGLNEMEHQGFSSALIKGIMTSYHRITDMKK